jgi:hypothetical protein
MADPPFGAHGEVSIEMEGGEGGDPESDPAFKAA